MNKILSVLFPILLTVPLGGIGIDLYAAGMPELANDLSVSSTKIKLTISLFLFGLFIGMLIFGILSDYFGRKIMQIVNSFIFLISSLIIPFSDSLSVVVFFRLIQGVSAGGLQAVARSMIAESFSKSEISKYSLYVTSVWGLGPIIGPWLGGVLTKNFGWEYCFYFFSFYGLLLAVINSFILKETNKSKHVMDLPSLLNDSRDIVLNKNFFLPVIAMGLAYSTLVSYGIVGPYFVVTNLGFSSVSYGNIGLIVGTGYLFGNVVYRFLLSKDYSLSILLKYSIYMSVLINTVAIIVSVIYPYINYVWIFDIVLTCFAMGFIYPIYMAKSVSSFTYKPGLASGLTISMVLFVTSIFSAFLNLIDFSFSYYFVFLYFVLSIFILISWYVDSSFSFIPLRFLKKTTNR